MEDKPIYKKIPRKKKVLAKKSGDIVAKGILDGFDKETRIVGYIHLQSCCMLPEVLRQQGQVRERARKKAHPDWFCKLCKSTYPRPMNFKNIKSRSIKYRMFDNTLVKSNRLFGCSSTLNLSNSAINPSLSNVAKFFFFIYL